MTRKRTVCPLDYGKTVIVVNEAYTSKTCSWNGKIIDNH
ncbi:MAG: hypothetical protein D6698_11440 [Gammaproteobacteria bacterium]|nr:MAG: hypothetical protein D6698_11440 [Gammaproteobacteria bacterium]